MERPRQPAPVKPREDRQTGFSLIEILITLLVISLGLSGWALLLGIGIATQRGAHSTSQAALLAYDLMERVRAQHIKATDPRATIYSKPFAEQELNTCRIRQAGADNDRICWHQLVRTRLPRGSARVTTDGDAFAIALFWFDPNAAADPRLDSRAKCEDPAGPDRVWSSNPIVNWVPVNAAPRPASCLQVQRWRLPL